MYLGFQLKLYQTHFNMHDIHEASYLHPHLLLLSHQNNCAKPNRDIPPWAIAQNTGLLLHKIPGFSPRQEAVFDFSVHPEGVDDVGN